MSYVPSGNPLVVKSMVMSSPGFSGVPVGVNGVHSISMPYVVPVGKSVSSVTVPSVATG